MPLTDHTVTPTAPTIRGGAGIDPASAIRGDAGIDPATAIHGDTRLDPHADADAEGHAGAAGVAHAEGAIGPGSLAHAAAAPRLDSDGRTDGEGTPALPRPLPPLTWRDRLDDLIASLPLPTRVAAVAGALAVAGVVAWRLLAPPAPPPEMEIPFAEQAAPTAGAPSADSGADAAGSDGQVPVAAAGLPPGAGAPTAGTGGEVVVHVAGAVAAPGVQRLPAGARVVDAVGAAGGAAPDADLGRINLAAPLVDGQQIYVLRAGESAPPAVPGPQGSGGGADGGEAAVDVNTASATELEELPGVGPAIAAAIVAHRDEHGPFTSVDGLLDVQGIGEAKLEQLRSRATV